MFRSGGFGGSSGGSVLSSSSLDISDVLAKEPLDNESAKNVVITKVSGNMPDNFDVSGQCSEPCSKGQTKAIWPEPKKSQDESKSHPSTITKTKSLLRDKFRDSKTWGIRRSLDNSKDSTNSGGSMTSNSSPNASNTNLDGLGEGRLSRLFSLRKSNLSSSGPNDSPKISMPRLAEEEEQMLGGSLPPNAAARKSLPPILQPTPPNLTPEQQKRRHIVASLVHSENNYVATLQRLVNDYKKPLEESHPPILSQQKVQTLFHRVPEILQCHLLFRIALSEAIKNWDTDEKIGDVFVASFSKAVVLEIYSDFINNFTVAMDCAKQESKRKSALADFLKVKQITAHDRVSFFGLMVKPVQRFPQFILLLQDLLKETPPGHPDRMALQLAMTTVESLAEMLNERKREAEQYAAFRDKISNISGRLSSKPLSGGEGSNRFLLKEDDMTQLEFNASGLVTRSKQRRLLLLNDLLLCVTVNGRSSEAEFNHTSSANERLSLKWAVSVSDVEIIDGTAGGTLARLLAPTASGTLSAIGKRASLGRSSNPVELGASPAGEPGGKAENLAQDMADLMHDFDVVSRISSLIGTMRTSYEGLTTSVTSQILSDIQRAIRQKDEEMSFMDACCLQLVIKGRNSKDKPESYTFQTRDPNVKKEWTVELRLAQLALDPSNSPGWDVLEQERSISTKMPLYVKSFQVYHSKQQTEVNCGCSYSLMVQTPTRTLRPHTYVWTNATDGHSSHLRIFSVPNQNTGLKELGTISLEHFYARTIQYVPGLTNGVANSSPDDPLRSDLVWVGVNTQKIILYSASDPERGHEIGRASLPAEVMCIQYHCEAVWVGLASGSMAVFRRDYSNGAWDLAHPSMIILGCDPVSCLLPIINGIYAACDKRVWVIDGHNNEQLKNFVVKAQHDSQPVPSSPASSTTNLAIGGVHQMAQSGVGLWVALKNSATICLYHTETFRHLQDINIASNVSRVLAARDVSQPARCIHVTALMASRGLLWVGTNVGIALTVPLPRLEGVPIISGRANISYHAHFGPVTFFLNVQPKVVTDVATQMQSNAHSAIQEESEHELKLESNEDSSSGCSSLVPTILESHEEAGGLKKHLHKQYSEGGLSSSSHPGDNEHQKLRVRNSSPLVMRRKSSREHRDQNVASRRASKTLPRGFSMTHEHNDMSSMDYDVFGLYGELLNVRDYDCDSGEISRQGEELRKSDPELSTIPYRVSTLDRRVRMKTSRPRSLDMSSWSVGSRGSTQTTSSSEAGSERPSPNVSRNASVKSQGTASVHSLPQHEPLTPSHSSPLSGGSHASSGPSSHDGQLNSNSLPATPHKPALKASQSSPAAGPQEAQPVSVSKARKKLDAPRTVTTLMGGRGYINWRRASVEKQRTTVLAQVNNFDSYLVIWEMKV
ncbi:hypothetical protein TCAL_02839 [Tigriopus californicus]|uniref:DH domain-containing protein n=1 Tax=Tigriopus californicus TaxID=6832 RepID=A0A553PN61_TIGCA|nr:rho guanine nucleotide exchange factor 10-like protein isoform X2 [Tigriopus californicus]TRY79106.1 hypothetical protein TCAL_02839 [Tigriopus californicus]